ncbi:MAG: hypothetical protein IPI67_30895 [Myxococcales bacterium]|nr:hypothetical protein [Myxococcales bacterium]
MPTRLPPACLACLLACVLVTGCGHPASEAECEEIVERVARLELEKKNGADKVSVEEEVVATKKSVRDSMLKECVGRRLTERAMACVRSAKSSKQVVEECFD